MSNRNEENSGSSWTREEIIVLRELSEMGASNKDLAKALGRSSNAVSFQKTLHGIRKNKRVKFTGIRTGRTEDSVVSEISEKEEIVTNSSTKDSAREITRVARQIARHNGKRITMAMFFVEDID